MEVDNKVFSDGCGTVGWDGWVSPGGGGIEYTYGA